jgi:hypothetical protein
LGYVEPSGFKALLLLTTIDAPDKEPDQADLEGVQSAFETGLNGDDATVVRRKTMRQSGHLAAWSTLEDPSGKHALEFLLIARPGRVWIFVVSTTDGTLSPATREQIVTSLRVP